MVGMAAHAILLHQNKRGKQHPLDRDDECQQDKRVGIERLYKREAARIDQKPKNQARDMNQDERHRTGESGDRVTDAVF
jgi:hypothetical protein